MLLSARLEAAMYARSWFSSWDRSVWENVLVGIILPEQGE